MYKKKLIKTSVTQVTPLAETNPTDLPPVKGRPPTGQACYDDRDCGTSYIGRR